MWFVISRLTFVRWIPLLNQILFIDCFQNNTAHLKLICRSIEEVSCLINMVRLTGNIKFVCDFVIKTITLHFCLLISWFSKYKIRPIFCVIDYIMLGFMSNKWLLLIFFTMLKQTPNAYKTKLLVLTWFVIQLRE